MSSKTSQRSAALSAAQQAESEAATRANEKSRKRGERAAREAEELKAFLNPDERERLQSAYFSRSSVWDPLLGEGSKPRQYTAAEKKKIEDAETRITQLLDLARSRQGGRAPLPPLEPIGTKDAEEVAAEDAKARAEIAAIGALKGAERERFVREHPDNLCAHCHKTAAHECGRCHEARYCDEACQRAHAHKHGPACALHKRGVAAAAATATTANIGNPIGHGFRRAYGGFHGGYNGYYDHPYYGYRSGYGLLGTLGFGLGAAAGAVAGAASSPFYDSNPVYGDSFYRGYADPGYVGPGYVGSGV